PVRHRLDRVPRRGGHAPSPRGTDALLRRRDRSVQGRTRRVVRRARDASDVSCVHPDHGLGRAGAGVLAGVARLPGSARSTARTRSVAFLSRRVLRTAFTSACEEVTDALGELLDAVPASFPFGAGDRGNAWDQTGV